MIGVMTEFVPFATVLRQTRRAREQSQQLIADLTGARQATVSRWEKGLLYPEPETLRALARYLEMPVADVRRLVERSELEAERAKVSERLSSLDEQLHALGV